MSLLTRLALAIGLTTLALPVASAYNVYSYPLEVGTGYGKWGPPQARTKGGVVTWSLMPTGTGLDAAAPPYIQGTSNLADVFNQVGGEVQALSLIQNAFDNWARVANIEFVYVGVDDGTPFSAPYAVGQSVGDIRIGGFLIDGFTAGLGFTPPPNGNTTLEGDILLNTRPEISFYDAPGAEGELYDLYPPAGGLYRNEFTGLILHELGHALGLLHSDVPTGCMCGYVSPEFDGAECAYFDSDGDGRAPINRVPDADDVAGIQFLYGPPPNANFDGDDDVDGDDFLAWQRGLGTDDAARIHGDADGDEDVDADDLGHWAAAYGQPTTIVSIPEPNACVLQLVGAFTVAAAARRRGK